VSFTDDRGDLPRNRLLDFLGDHIGSDHPISEMAEKSELSRPTVYAALPELMKRGLVVETRKLGTSRMFALNTESPLVQAVLSQDFEKARGAAEVEAHKAKQTRPRQGAARRRPSAKSA
jgi:DNA-binding transcriptional ArsR family regulator